MTTHELVNLEIDYLTRVTKKANRIQLREELLAHPDRFADSELAALLFFGDEYELTALSFLGNEYEYEHSNAAHAGSV